MPDFDRCSFNEFEDSKQICRAVLINHCADFISHAPLIRQIKPHKYSGFPWFFKGTLIALPSKNNYIFKNLRYEKVNASFNNRRQ